ncbi:MAG: sigma factor [Chloroflexota bacterium]|nr:sigma factor [Chloroflexota bacterium]
MATLQEETQARLGQMEPDVRRLARYWSLSRPHAQDDLAQVARLAIWQALRRHPDAPEPLLVRIAQDAISHELVRGRSVDNRLNPVSKRRFRWLIESLDAPDPDGPHPIADALASGPVHAHNLWESPTEAEAMGHVLHEMLRAILTPQEDAVLTLFLVGYWNKEAGELLGLTKKQVRWARCSLRKKLATLTEDGVVPVTRTEDAARRAAQAKWGRLRPFHMAPEVVWLLSELMEALRQ